MNTNELSESFEGLPVQDNLIDDTLVLVRSEPFRHYHWRGISIIEREPKTSDVYPLSTKEVLSIIDYYGCTDVLKKITISNNRLVNLQGLQETSPQTKNKAIELHIPSDTTDWSKSGEIWAKRAKKGLRWNALFTLLHELGHVMMYDHTYKEGDVEKKADEFADIEIEKFANKLIFGCD